jgi:hypothetical protein
MSKPVIPPGTEHVWTPAEDVVVTGPEETATAEEVITGLALHAIVRNQDQEAVTALATKLENIWTDYKAGKFPTWSLTDQLGNFRNNDLQNLDEAVVDNVTVQAMEYAIITMLSESSQ